MKKSLSMLYMVILAVFFSSCCTLFTSSRQSITFTGTEGAEIYNVKKNLKLGKISNDKPLTIKIKKKMADQQFIAKKEGYVSAPLLLESSFNAVCILNIFFWPGFIIDLATEQMNKYDDSMLHVELEPIQE